MAFTPIGRIRVNVTGGRGLSDYEVWIQKGNLGSYQEYLNYLADIVIQNNEGFKGDKGNPGGNVMSIGLFAIASTIAIPAGTEVVRTSGHTQLGIGEAHYIADTAVNAAFVATYPRAAFIDNAGRGFRIDETVLHPFMFGGLPSTGSPYTNVYANRELFTDCSPAIEAMLNFGATRADRPIYDFRSRGMGISRTVNITADTGGFFNSRPLYLFPGRLVAMAAMTNMVAITGSNVSETGYWNLVGGYEWRLGNPLTDPAYYQGRLAKNGLYLSGVAGSRLGGVHAQGLKRYAVQFDKRFAGDNNSIGTRVGQIVATHCGSSPSSEDFEITGTYTSPNGRAGANNGNAQTQDLLLTSKGAGFDLSDLEVGDLIEVTSAAGKQQTARVQAVQAAAGTQRLVTVYPWVSGTTGTFRSYHGGGLSTTHFNMANTTFEGVINLYNGTGWEMACQYAPTVRTVLAEGCGCGLSFGGGGGGQEGMNLEHYHFENVRRAIVDTNVASVKNCWVRVASNLAFTEGSQFFNLCEVLTPGFIDGGGVYYQYPRATGLSIEFNGITYRGKGGGAASTLQGQSIAYSLSNTPVYRYGPIQEYGNGSVTEIKVLIDKSAVTFFGDELSTSIPFYFFGTASSGALSQNVRFSLDAGGPSGITLNGGAGPIVIDRTLYIEAPIRGRIILVPDVNGASAVNARIFIDTPLKSSAL